MRTANPIICGNPRNLRIKDAVGYFKLEADANKILRQRGITLVQNGESHILNNTNWLDHTDIFNVSNAVMNAMLNSTNSMGNAIELYFVDTLEGGSALGMRSSDGIVIAARGNGVTVAHETLHDCGTKDIYTVEINDPNLADPHPIPGLISEDRLLSDWGGGYYPPELPQRELVGRLIMRSGGVGDDPPQGQSRDLPGGTVFGWRHIGDGASPITLGQAGVGQSSIQRNPGSY